MVRPRSLLVVGALFVCALASRGATVERPISEARVGLASPTSPNSVLGAFNGERFLVAWVSIDRGGQAMVLDRTGAPVAGTATGLPFTPIGTFWNGEVWIVVASDGWVRINGDGVLLDRQARPLDRPSGSISIRGMAWTGTSLVVAVLFQQPTFPTVLKVVTYDAQMQRRATHDIATGSTSVWVASDGGSALILHQQEGAAPRPSYATILARDGTPLRSKSFSVEAPVAIGTTGNGGGYRVAYWKGRQHSTALFGSYHLDQQLVHTESHETFGLSSGLFGTGRTLTWDGSAFVFFYGTGGTRAARLSANGVMLENDLILSSNDYNYGIGSRGLVGVSGGGTNLVFYTTTSKVFGAGVAFLQMRVGGDVAGLAASESREVERGAFQQTANVAASSSTQSLVVWRERVAPTAPLWVYAARVDATGNVRDPQSLLLGDESCERAMPSVASDGDGFLAAWYDNDGLMSAHVRADGTVGAKTLVNRFRDTPCHGGAPKVISNGSGYLVVWTREKEFRDDVFASRVSSAGALLDTVPLEMGTTTGPIDGASDGNGYLLAWDGRVMRIDANGMRLDPRIGANAGTFAGGESTLVVWWNGTTYSLLQAERYNFAYRYQFARVATNGTVVKVGDWVAFPSPPWDWGTGDATCEGSTCTFIHGTPEDGAWLLREVHATDHDVSPSIAWGDSISLAPFLMRSSQVTPPPVTPFRVAGGRRFAAFTRFALAQPYAGISRVFVAPMDAAVRTRGVRH